MKTQKGMTFTGILLMVCCIGFFVYIIMRVTPVYIEHYTVSKALESINDIPKEELVGHSGMISYIIKKKLEKQFQIDEIRHIKAKDIDIKRISGGYKISIKYDSVQPVYKNIDLLFHFNVETKVLLSE